MLRKHLGITATLQIRSCWDGPELFPQYRPYQRIRKWVRIIWSPCSNSYNKLLQCICWNCLKTELTAPNTG